MKAVPARHQLRGVGAFIFCQVMAQRRKRAMEARHQEATPRRVTIRNRERSIRKGAPARLPE
jgi:hypothetical protein